MDQRRREQETEGANELRRRVAEATEATEASCRVQAANDLAAAVAAAKAACSMEHDKKLVQQSSEQARRAAKEQEAAVAAAEARWRLDAERSLATALAQQKQDMGAQETAALTAIRKEHEDAVVSAVRDANEAGVRLQAVALAQQKRDLAAQETAALTAIRAEQEVALAAAVDAAEAAGARSLADALAEQKLGLEAAAAAALAEVRKEHEASVTQAVTAAERSGARSLAAALAKQQRDMTATETAALTAIRQEQEVAKTAAAARLRDAVAAAEASAAAKASREMSAALEGAAADAATSAKAAVAAAESRVRAECARAAAESTRAAVAAARADGLAAGQAAGAEEAEAAAKTAEEQRLASARASWEKEAERRLAHLRNTAEEGTRQSLLKLQEIHMEEIQRHREQWQQEGAKATAQQCAEIESLFRAQLTSVEREREDAFAKIAHHQAAMVQARARTAASERALAEAEAAAEASRVEAAGAASTAVARTEAHWAAKSAAMVAEAETRTEKAASDRCTAALDAAESEWQARLARIGSDAGAALAEAVASARAESAEEAQRSLETAVAEARANESAAIVAARQDASKEAAKADEAIEAAKAAAQAATQAHAEQVAAIEANAGEAIAAAKTAARVAAQNAAHVAAQKAAQAHAEQVAAIKNEAQAKIRAMEEAAAAEAARQLELSTREHAARSELLAELAESARRAKDGAERKREQETARLTALIGDMEASAEQEAADARRAQEEAEALWGQKSVLQEKALASARQEAIAAVEAARKQAVEDQAAAVEAAKVAEMQRGESRLAEVEATHAQLAAAADNKSRDEVTAAVERTLADAERAAEEAVQAARAASRETVAAQLEAAHAKAIKEAEAAHAIALAQCRKECAQEAAEVQRVARKEREAEQAVMVQQLEQEMQAIRENACRTNDLLKRTRETSQQESEKAQQEKLAAEAVAKAAQSELTILREELEAARGADLETAVDAAVAVAVTREQDAFRSELAERAEREQARLDNAVQAVTEEVTRAVTNEITQQVTADVTQQVTAEVSVDVTRRVTADVTERVTRQVTADVTQSVTGEVTEQVTQEVTANVTRRVAEEVTQDVTDRVTAVVTQRVTEEVTEQVTADVTAEVTDRVTREVTADVSERVAEEVTRDVTERVTREVTADVTERVTQELTEQLTAAVTADVTADVTEQTRRQVTTDVTQRVTDEVTERVTRHVTADVTRRVSEEVTKDVTERVTADVTAEVAARVTREVTADVTARVTREVTEEVTDEVTARVTTDVTRQVTQRVTDEVTEEVTARVTADVTEEVTAQVTQQVTDEVTQSVTASVTDQVTQLVTADVTSRVTGEVTARLSLQFEEARAQLDAAHATDKENALAAQRAAMVEMGSAELREALQSVRDLATRDREQALCEAEKEREDALAECRRTLAAELKAREQAIAERQQRKQEELSRLHDEGVAAARSEERAVCEHEAVVAREKMETEHRIALRDLERSLRAEGAAYSAAAARRTRAAWQIGTALERVMTGTDRLSRRSAFRRWHRETENMRRAHAQVARDREVAQLGARLTMLAMHRMQRGVVPALRRILSRFVLHGARTFSRAQAFAVWARWTRLEASHAALVSAVRAQAESVSSTKWEAERDALLDEAAREHETAISMLLERHAAETAEARTREMEAAEALAGDFEARRIAQEKVWAEKLRKAQVAAASEMTRQQENARKESEAFGSRLETQLRAEHDALKDQMGSLLTAQRTRHAQESRDARMLEQKRREEAIAEAIEETEKRAASRHAAAIGQMRSEWEIESANAVAAAVRECRHEERRRHTAEIAQLETALRATSKAEVDALSAMQAELNKGIVSPSPTAAVGDNGNDSVTPVAELLPGVPSVPPIIKGPAAGRGVVMASTQPRQVLGESAASSKLPSDTPPTETKGPTESQALGEADGKVPLKGASRSLADAVDRRHAQSRSPHRGGHSSEQQHGAQSQVFGHRGPKPHTSPQQETQQSLTQQNHRQQDREHAAMEQLYRQPPPPPQQQRHLQHQQPEQRRYTQQLSGQPAAPDPQVATQASGAVSEVQGEDASATVDDALQGQLEPPVPSAAAMTPLPPPSSSMRSLAFTLFSAVLRWLRRSERTAFRQWRHATSLRTRRLTAVGNLLRGLQTSSQDMHPFLSANGNRHQHQADSGLTVGSFVRRLLVSALQRWRNVVALHLRRPEPVVSRVMNGLVEQMGRRADKCYGTGNVGASSPSSGSAWSAQTPFSPQSPVANCTTEEDIVSGSVAFFKRKLNDLATAPSAGVSPTARRSWFLRVCSELNFAIAHHLPNVFLSETEEDEQGEDSHYKQLQQLLLKDISSAAARHNHNRPLGGSPTHAASHFSFNAAAAATSVAAVSDAGSDADDLQTGAGADQESSSPAIDGILLQTTGIRNAHVVDKYGYDSPSRSPQAWRRPLFIKVRGGNAVPEASPVRTRQSAATATAAAAAAVSAATETRNTDSTTAAAAAAVDELRVRVGRLQDGLHTGPGNEGKGRAFRKDLLVRILGAGYDGDVAELSFLLRKHAGLPAASSPRSATASTKLLPWLLRACAQEDTATMVLSRDDMLPLHRAISGFHFHGNAPRALEVLSILVAQGGANVNAVDSSGNGLLHRSLLAFTASTIRAVVSRLCGAASSSSSSSSSSIMQPRTLQNEFVGLDMNARNSSGETALHVEIKMLRHASADVVRTLLKDGRADPNLPDAEGRSPLVLALTLAHRSCFSTTGGSTGSSNSGALKGTPGKPSRTSHRVVGTPGDGPRTGTSVASLSLQRTAGLWSGGSFWLDVATLLVNAGGCWWGPAVTLSATAVQSRGGSGVARKTAATSDVADLAPFRDRSLRTPLHLLVAVIPSLAECETTNGAAGVRFAQHYTLLELMKQCLAEMRAADEAEQRGNKTPGGIGLAFGSPTSAWGWDWTDGAL